jgi:hypothetical protein
VHVNQICEEGGCTLESSGARCVETGGGTPWNHMVQEGALVCRVYFHYR